MKNLIIGFVLGMFFVGVAWAAQAIVLIDGSNNAIGTAANPLVVQGV